MKARPMSEDGSGILALKTLFLEKETEEALLALLKGLHGKHVYTLMNTEISEEDREKLLNADVGEALQLEQEMGIKPHLLMTEEHTVWFPIFSMESEIPESELEKYTLLRLPISQCLEFAHAVDIASGLMLDPFTDGMNIPFELADLIDQLR